MEIHVDRAADPVFVALQGELGFSDTHRLEESVSPLLAESSHAVVIDLAEVPRIDSRGLAALVSLTARSHLHQGKLVLARPSVFVAELFNVTRLDSYLTIAGDLESARNAAIAR
jgi:anti-anti-sigma factor